MKFPNSFPLLPFLSLCSACLATPAIAGGAAFDLRAIEAYSLATDEPRITSSEQFSDLQPQDWAY